MFHFEKLKDLSCADEYAVTVSNRFEVLDALEDQVKLWNNFKRETLEAAIGCVGERSRSRGGFALAGTVVSIEKESHC